MSQKELFVLPALPTKIGGSANTELHHKYFPIGLLKLATLSQRQGNEVYFAIGNGLPPFEPDMIYITTIFTYWERHYEDCIRYYRLYYPKAKIVLGGIYASLWPERARAIGADGVHIGLVQAAEGIVPNYGLLPSEVDFAVVHSQRGCVSRCDYCGTYKIEPEFVPKDVQTLIGEIEETVAVHGIRKFAFYDNNPLAHPDAKLLLERLANFQDKQKRPLQAIEFQSGFDTRFLDQETANLIKAARVINPRIAWDDPGKSKEANVEKSIQYFLNAGYKPKDLRVFMIFNHEQRFEDLEEKRRQCQRWGVQISDCRYVPLDLFEDRYQPNGHSADYYIHPAWSDGQIREFRRRVRGQNILLRHLGTGKMVGESWRKYSIPEVVIKEFKGKVA